MSILPKRGDGSSDEPGDIPHSKRAFSPPHLKEWIEGSGVGPELCKLNTEYLDRHEPFERLFYSNKIKRLNTGRLPSWILNRYKHLERGGWWCSGVDPIAGREDLWGCFKPDHPRIDTAKGKHQKYEHPLKAQATLFALKVTDEIWKKVGKRYDVAVLPTDVDQGRDDRGFWSWVRVNKIPLILTEGVKKAGALLSIGFAAIALPGIWGGYRKNEGKPSLIPQLEYFVSKNRQVYFAFDQDEKRSTRQANRKALWHTAKLLKDKGCFTFICEWEPWIKGVDDLIVSLGETRFNECYLKALAFDDWCADALKELNYKPALRLDSSSKYLGDFTPPPNAKLICLKAPKGSGKTEWLVKVCAEAQASGQKVLILTHRTQLGKALCERFGIDYVTELKESNTQGVFGYGLCFDSLRRNSQARFNPEDWHGCIVILDECEQSIWHLLDAKTEVSAHRVEVLRNFHQLIQNTLDSDEGRVYLSDADLSDVSIDYIRSLVDFPIEPWIVIKEGNPTPWNVTVWQTPEELLGALVSHIRQGGRPMIFVDGQKAKSKWGTQNLEAYLQKLFPEISILRIDAESVADPKHCAYGCIEKLDDFLPNYQVTIASPTIETGVSIDIKGHITSVWDFAQGVIPVPSVLQRMARVREAVPRHVWAKNYGIGRIGNGSTSPRGLMAGQETKFKAHVKLLTEADTPIDFLAASNFHPQSQWTWVKMAARINLGMYRYRHEVLRELVREGHSISIGNYLEILNADEEALGTSQTKDELTETRDKNYEAHCTAIAETPNPDDERYETLKKKKERTQPERLEYRRGELSRKYSPELVTPELVELDDDREHPKAQLHYYLTIGREFLPNRDKQKIEKMLDQDEVFLPDANRSLIGGKIKLLEFLGINKLLEQTTDVSSQSEVVINVKEKTKQYPKLIKDVLGLSFKFNRKNKHGEIQEPSPIAIAQKYLRDCFGLEFTQGTRKGSRGNQVWQYKPIEVSEVRQKILEVWRQRDLEAQAAKAAQVQQAANTPVVTTASSNSVEGGCITDELQNVVVMTGNIDIDQVMTTSSDDCQLTTTVTTSKSGVDSVDFLVSLFESCFESCEVDDELTEIAKFYEVSSQDGTQIKPDQKAELVETAILFSPSSLKSKLRKWWDKVFWDVRDFWKSLEQLSEPIPE